MASTVTLASVSDSLSQVFEDRLVRQINRKQGLLSLLPKRVGAGKNCAWDPEFDGAKAASGADGDDIDNAEYGSDDTKPAVLNWANYRAPFRVGAQAQAAARTSHSPVELRTLFRSKTFGSVSKLGDVINKRLFSGDGTTNEIMGIFVDNGPIDDAGTFATIDRSVDTEWQGNVLGNSGTPRLLTQDLMREAIRDIFTRCGEHPDLIVTDPFTWDLFGSLLDTNRRPIYEITTAAGLITMRGGWSALEFDGIPVVRDKDATAGNMAFINTNYMLVEFLPTYAGQQNSDDTDLYAVHDDKGSTSGLPCRINMLGRTGQADKAYLDIFPILKVSRPNSHAWLQDLTTTP